MEESPRASGELNLASWSRLLFFLLLLVAFVIGPFVLWGGQLDAHAPKLVEGQATKLAIAMIGIGLLVLDVLLPVPSSVVSITLCLLLGPLWGGVTVFAGMVGAFSGGFLLGRLLPAARLREWVGPPTWDLFATKQLPASLLWIAASRPVPVLAEVTSLFAGSLRMPFGPSIAAAALSSLLVASAYALAASLGLHNADFGTPLFVLSAACLPTLSWAALQLIRRSRLEK